MFKIISANKKLRIILFYNNLNLFFNNYLRIILLLLLFDNDFNLKLFYKILMIIKLCLKCIYLLIEKIYRNRVLGGLVRMMDILFKCSVFDSQREHYYFVIVQGYFGQFTIF